MKKSVRTLIGASVAAVLGSTLLLGGAGTLAFWSDTASGAAQTIQSGELDLGSSAELTMTSPTIKQCTPECTDNAPYVGGALVPGDIVSVTVNVPVTLVGQNMKANFAITPNKAAVTTTGTRAVADAALTSALSIKVVKVNGAPATADAAGTVTVPLTPTAARTNKVPVVVEIAFPWGTAGQYNDTMGGQVAMSASYTLTQIAK